MLSKNYRLQLRFFLLIGLLMVVAFSIIAWVVSEKTGQLAREEAVERIREIAHHQSQELGGELNEALGVARSLAVMLQSTIKNRPTAGREANDRLFIQTIESNPFLFGVWAVFEPNAFDGRDAEYAGKPHYPSDGSYVPFAFRREGKITFKHDEYSFEKDQDYFTIPKRNRRETVIPPYVDSMAQNVLMTSLCVPIFERNQVIGVVGVDILLSSFNDTVARIRPYEVGYAFLISHNGIFVGHPRREFSNQHASSTGISTTTLAVLRAGHEARESHVDPLTGHPTLFQYVPLRIGNTATPWSLALAIPIEQFMKKATAITNMTIFIGFLSLVMLGIFLMLLASSILQPLRRAERTLRQVLDMVLDGIIVHTGDGRIVDWNHRFMDMFRISHDDVGRYTVQDLLPDRATTSDAVPLVDLWKQVLGGAEQHCERIGRSPNSAQEFPLEAYLCRMDFLGEPVILASFRDISERVRLAKERELTLERVRRQGATVATLSLFHGEDDVSFILAQTTELASHAMQVERVSIWKGSGDEGKITCLDLYSASTKTHSSGMFIDAGENPEYFAALANSRVVDASSALTDPRTRRFADSYFAPHGITSLLDSAIRLSGKVTGVISFEQVGPPRCWTPDEIRFAGEIADQIAHFFNHYERKRAEEERLRLEDQIRQTQKLESLGILAGGIAHDFNNLLLTIIGNIDMAISDSSKNSPTIPYLLEADKASRHAADLCRQMLAYSGRGHFIVAALDLSALIEEMFGMLELSVGCKAVLSKTLRRDLPAINADSSQIRQIVMNLVINAAEAMPPTGGNISVTTGVTHGSAALFSQTVLKDTLPEGPYVFIEVADTGSGMDEATKKRIFDPFFTTKFTGRGLGLAAVLGIVRGHQGTIFLESTPGKGTTFRVYFPAVSKAVVQEKAPARSDSSDVFSGAVLLVDDDSSIRKMTRSLLQRMGFTVFAASDGIEGLEMLRANLQQAANHSAEAMVLIILDLTMPNMDGETMFRELRVISPTIPVLMSSGFSEVEITHRFGDGGPTAFIQKPYDLNSLRTKIKSILTP